MIEQIEDRLKFGGMPEGNQHFQKIAKSPLGLAATSDEGKDLASGHGQVLQAAVNLDGIGGERNAAVDQFLRRPLAPRLDETRGDLTQERFAVPRKRLAK